MEKDNKQMQKEIETINYAYLDIFSESMKMEGLSTKTLTEHYSNMDFFLNVFLTHYDLVKMEDGPDQIDNFFSFFIDSCAWASKNSIKSSASSIKKFYKCMVDHGYITKSVYDELAKNIKETLPLWIEELETYLHGSTDEIDEMNTENDTTEVN